MSVISIVQVNVTQVVAPTPATLQQTGALVSQGGTTNSPNSSIFLTQLSDLTPYLPTAAANTSIAWATGTATVTTTSPHGIPSGATVYVVIAGATPAAYNGVYLATQTGASTFTYPLVSDGGTTPATVPGTWYPYAATELLQMATTFFAQGSNTGVYVLEFGLVSPSAAITALTAYLTANPNSNYTPGANGYYYSYLVPRSWDNLSGFLSLIASYENTTAKTYFFTTTTLNTYTFYTTLMKDVVSLIESPPQGSWQGNVLTALSSTSLAATATTTTAHGVLPGQWFQITGCTPAGYNGWWRANPGTTGSTLDWTLTATAGAESVLGSLVANNIANTGVNPNTSTEFSLAAPFWNSLHYYPSTSNRVTPFEYSFVFGVTPFPTQFKTSLLSTLKNSFANVIGTGAEGGISNTILLWGTTQDGNDFTYWYSVDWVQINLDLNTSNAIINGNNNPINPLYYNQNGINVLQGVAASTMNQGITYGLVLGSVTLTALDGPILDLNLDQGQYVDQTVVNAVPFIIYSEENPSDYKIGRYAGLAVVYMPNRGFSQVVYNVSVTELIAF